MRRSVFILLQLASVAFGSVPFGYLTPGTPWPMPMSYKTSNDALALTEEFVFSTGTGHTCDILNSGFDRQYAYIFDYAKEKEVRHWTLPEWERQHQAFDAVAGQISKLDVHLVNPCETYPTYPADESYNLTISASGASLSANTVWGALYGLETFGQLVYEPPYESHGMFMINETVVVDAPRFPYRGMMMDTARHFYDVGYIKQFMDLMAMNKMNVLHWHLVDDSSFPYSSKTFPDLSMKGAYQPYTHVYSQEDIKDLVEYGRVRGIRIIPEFDTPGHTQSWGKGQPGLLTECYGTDGKPNGQYGPIDPTKNSTYEFMAKFLAEVFSVFPEKNIHLGGDEVSFACWQSNPNINAWMKTMNISGNYAKLEEYYVQRVLDLVKQLSPDHGYTVWQEVFDNGVKMKPDTLVEVWIGSTDKTRESYRKELTKVTQAGYQTLLSAGWYLNRIDYGEDWVSFYYNDPQDFSGTDEQKKLVIGGEGCMWSEWVDGTNLISRTWPRASAVAERLWSPQSFNNATLARDRLAVHRCRMLQRGYSVEPVYIGYCPQEFKPTR